MIPRPNGAALHELLRRMAQPSTALHWAMRFLILALLTADSPAFPDSWSLPKRESYRSENGAFVLVVSPKKLSSQLDYFEDKVEGRTDAGGVPGLRGNSPLAELYRAGPTRRQRRIAKFPLINEVSPVSALVSDDGKWVVTFDNWHSLGLGDSVIVIYHSDGSLVRSLALEDVLLEDDLEELSRSVSSRRWARGKRIDTARARLVLQISRCDWGSKCVETPGTLEIDLNDGSLIGPKRQLVPHVVARVALSASGAQEWLRVGEGALCPSGAADSGDTTRVPITFDDLRPVGSNLDQPQYTKLAWKARIQGPVVLELLVAQDGSVECAEVVRSLPFGLADASRAVAMGWKLRPGPLPAKTRVTFDFRSGEEPIPAAGSPVARVGKSE